MHRTLSYTLYAMFSGITGLGLTTETQVVDGLTLF